MCHTHKDSKWAHATMNLTKCPTSWPSACYQVFPQTNWCLVYHALRNHILAFLLIHTSMDTFAINVTETRMILRNHTYLKVYKCWWILPIFKTPTIKCLAIFFKKKFNFQRILYHLYNNLAILRVKKIYPIKIGWNKASKNEKWWIFFWRKTTKNSPWAKFRP